MNVKGNESELYQPEVVKVVAGIHISCQCLVLMLIKHPVHRCLSQRKEKDLDLDRAELSAMLEGTHCIDSTKSTNRQISSIDHITEGNFNCLAISVSRRSPQNDP